MTEYWAELAWLGGTEPASRVSISTEAGRIATVQTATDPAPDAVRLQGLTLPGLANTHSHAFHRALRGRTHRTRGSFWSWRDQMYEVAAKLNPDSYEELATAVFREMVLAGYTVVGEFHYLHHTPSGRPYDDPNQMGEALLAAARAAGIRITLLDTLYLHGGLDSDGYVEPTGPQVRFSDGSVDAWRARIGLLAPQGLARLGAAVHSVRAVDPNAINAAADWARTAAAPLHVHVSEQTAENEQCLAAHGKTPTQVLADAGATGPNFTAVHGTHLDEADIGQLGGDRCTVCFCPTTERDLADGIGPSAELVEAGVQLAVGSDSHAVIDGFEEARAVELNQRLARRVRGSHQPVDLLRVATEAGYRSLGWPEGGTLTTGALADFVTVDLSSPRLAGIDDAHVIDATIFAGSAADVQTVVIGGEQVVTDGNYRG